MDIPQELKDYIDDKIQQAMSFSTTKYGDTPTDALQLTPKKYVTSIVAGISGGSPGGASGDVQFNDGAGGFAGNSALNYDEAGGQLSIGDIKLNNLSESFIDTTANANGMQIQATGSLNLEAGSLTGTVTLDVDANNKVVQVGGGVDFAVNPDTVFPTNTNQGFVFIPAMNGTPTGTPTAHATSRAFCFDRSSDKLYVYNGSWKSVTLT